MTSGPSRRTALLDAACRTIARHGVRGMRVEEVAAAAGVSVPLIYYHFGNRAGLLAAALRHVSARAQRYVSATAGRPGLTGRRLEARLLGELEGDQAVRDNSIVWGELCWAAVFEADLRPVVAEVTRAWVDDVAADVSRALGQEGPAPSGPAQATAERLVALVDGLSGRWLTGTLPLHEARRLLRLGVRAELDQAAAAPPPNGHEPVTSTPRIVVGQRA